jgi:endophilin-A
MAAKWFNKQTQAVSEKFNKDARRTGEDAEFTELAQQSEATRKAVMQVIDRVPMFLHPNPNSRLKAAVGTSVAKLRKTAAEKRYPHASGELSAALLKGAEEFPPDSAFGQGLRCVGDALAAVCEAQHLMDGEVQQNLVNPMKDLTENELKEIAKQKKKLEGRRLDLDFKQRKRESGKSTVTDEDLTVAKQKYEDSKISTENAMANLVNNDTEQASQLLAFISAYITCTKSTLEHLEEAKSRLEEIVSESSTRPKREVRPVSSSSRDDDDDDDDRPAVNTGDGPAALAAYDFEAENEGEISFKEGQTIKLISRLDENWLEGEVNGKRGIFPTNYVEIIRDL